MKMATSKAYSLIQGTTDQGIVNVFEGMMDFLIALVHFKKEQPPNDTIILNSIALAGATFSKLQKYDQVNLYLDNDQAGTKATRQIQEKHPKAIDRRDIFMPSFCPYTLHKDFNDFLIGKKRLVMVILCLNYPKHKLLQINYLQVKIPHLIL